MWGKMSPCPYLPCRRSPSNCTWVWVACPRSKRPHCGFLPCASAGWKLLSFGFKMLVQNPDQPIKTILLHHVHPGSLVNLYRIHIRLGMAGAAPWNRRNRWPNVKLRPSQRSHEKNHRDSTSRKRWTTSAV